MQSVCENLLHILQISVIIPMLSVAYIIYYKSDLMQVAYQLFYNCCIVKNLGGPVRIENIGGLSIYTKGILGQTKKFADETLVGLIINH